MARTVSKKTTATTASKSTRSKSTKKTAKTAKKKTEAAAKKAAKPKKAATPVEAGDVQAAEHLGKIQCFNRRKKTICAHLLLATHKCGAKTIGHGRLATVRIGKKRRCELYEETAFTA